MKKSYILSFILIILGIFFFTITAVGSMHSYVRSDGLLVEPFAQIVLGAIFGCICMTLGIIIGLCFSMWSLFHNPKKADTYIFGVFSVIVIITTLYVFLAMIQT